MDQPPPEPWTLRSGEFEADLRIGEVRRDGRKVPLQDKPFRALALLLARPRLKLPARLLVDEIYLASEP